jgi:hypothetical protein
VASQYTQYEVHQREQKEGMYGQNKPDRKQVYEDGETYKALVSHLQSKPDFTNYSPDHLSVVIKNATNRLQTADLTINFKAKTWFKNPNDYNSFVAALAGRFYPSQSWSNTNLKIFAAVEIGL